MRSLIDLQSIGTIKCKSCNGICLLDYYLRIFRCQKCGKEYIIL